MADPAPLTPHDPAEDDVLELPPTVAQLPFFTAGRFPKPTLLGQCRGDQIDYTSGRELLEQVRDLSLGLAELGMRPGDHVALLSESRPEWLRADLAVLAAGAITTPIYTTLAAEQVAFILRDVAAGVLIVSTTSQLDKIATIVSECPDLRTIIVMDLPDGDVAARQTVEGAGRRVYTLEHVAELGHGTIRSGWGVARAFHDAARRVSPDDVATIIYTSGTTGQPKGVVLTHGNLMANVQGAIAALDLRDEDVALSFLPLCHAFERIVSYIYLAKGLSMVFAESMDTVPRDLRTVRPTVMSGVPRVFEKLYARIQERGAAVTGVRRVLFRWAMSVARRRGARVPERRPLGWRLGMESAVVGRLVFATIRDGVGGRLRFAVSGSAPLDTAIARFFFGIGLPILEGYGLTETSPVLSVMPIGRVRLGTVGPPLPNVELRVADDGEILARGPNVMRGYHNRPDETAAVLVDGWFHTGDIGSLDAEGYLRITDRKKEVLVTSGGKKIAPQPIEHRLSAHALVAEAVMVGDRRHFPAALLTPDCGPLGAALGVDAVEARRRLETPEVRARYQAIVDEVNEGLAQFERIKKFALVADEWTIANGTLTPTLKVRRRVVEARYRDVIESLYLA